MVYSSYGMTLGMTKEAQLAQGNVTSVFKFNIGRRWFYSYANCPFEYIYDVGLTTDLVYGLTKQGVDIVNFLHRSFLHEAPVASYLSCRELENYAIMKITSYDDWWKNTLKKKERQSVNKATKNGVEVRCTEANDDFLRGMQKVYNETPFREGRRYSGYGQSLSDMKKKFEDIGDSDLLGAYIGRELIGLLWITYGDRAAMFRSFVSFLKHRDKCPNNALISEAVRSCAKRNIHFLVYGNKFGFLPNLDRFRESQGFRKFPLPRYYVPLTAKGHVAIKLGLHRKIEYSLPLPLERALLKLYNAGSHFVPAGIWYKLAGE